MIETTKKEREMNRLMFDMITRDDRNWNSMKTLIFFFFSWQIVMTQDHIDDMKYDSKSWLDIWQKFRHRFILNERWLDN